MNDFVTIVSKTRYVIHEGIATLVIDRDSTIYVSGHAGLVGSAVVRTLAAVGFSRILTASRRELDLRDQHAVDQWFDAQRPQYVIHVAGTVGGIHANTKRPADFLYDNLMIHATVMHAAWRFDVRRLLYLGSSCIYPRDCPQPIKEEYLLTGPLEETNQAYAIAKIAGVKSALAYREQYGCDFIAAMPTNLYGPFDRFDLNDSHVLPALIRKFHDAKTVGNRDVTVWGTGRPRREFLFVDDLAAACLHLLENYFPPKSMNVGDPPEWINVGTGEDLSIAELADVVKQIVYPQAEIVYKTSEPDGTPQKLLDVSRIHATGWNHRVSLAEGIERTYRWYVENGTEKPASQKSNDPAAAEINRR